MCKIGKTKQPFNLPGDARPAFSNDNQQTAIAGLRNHKQIASSSIQRNIGRLEI
ncbi:hypothetical protein ALO43_200561 [Pseudomonas tremae]|uniref:Uncharacterized protein n=1 Tax=Pseudomonas tremae TaxID=200454 RepID=A0AA40P1U2_9PSED|nr:hypothetical protein ALO43_200561 [Pseudomonas tremae]